MSLRQLRFREHALVQLLVRFPLGDLSLQIGLAVAFPSHLSESLDSLELFEVAEEKLEIGVAINFQLFGREFTHHGKPCLFIKVQVHISPSLTSDFDADGRAAFDLD